MRGNVVVVVADDEAPIRQFVSETLSEELGVRVVVARDGMEALEHVWTLKPSILLLDWMMPRLDGAEVCRMLEENPPPWGMVTLAMSANGRAREALASGCRDFLAKPFRIETLLVKVEEWLPVS